MSDYLSTPTFPFLIRHRLRRSILMHLIDGPKSHRALIEATGMPARPNRVHLEATRLEAGGLISGIRRRRPNDIPGRLTAWPETIFGLTVAGQKALFYIFELGEKPQMTLREYLIFTGQTGSTFAKRVGCSIEHLWHIADAKNKYRASDRLARRINRLTGGRVPYDAVRSQLTMVPS